MDCTKPSASKLSDLKTLRFSSNFAPASLTFPFAEAPVCAALDRDDFAEAIINSFYLCKTNRLTKLSKNRLAVIGWFRSGGCCSGVDLGKFYFGEFRKWSTESRGWGIERRGLNSPLKGKKRMGFCWVGFGWRNVGVLSQKRVSLFVGLSYFLSIYIFNAFFLKIMSYYYAIF